MTNLRINDMSYYNGEITADMVKVKELASELKNQFSELKATAHELEQFDKRFYGSGYTKRSYNNTTIKKYCSIETIKNTAMLSMENDTLRIKIKVRKNTIMYQIELSLISGCINCVKTTKSDSWGTKLDIDTCIKKIKSITSQLKRELNKELEGLQ